MASNHRSLNTAAQKQQPRRNFFDEEELRAPRREMHDREFYDGDDEEKQFQDYLGSQCDSLVSRLQSASRVAAESEDIAAHVAQELNDQGEKLNRISKQVDEINNNLVMSKAHIGDMKRGFFASFILPSKTRSVKLNTSPAPTVSKMSVPLLHNKSNNDDHHSSSSSNVATFPNSPMTKEDRITTIRDIDTRLDPHYDTLQMSVRRLKAQALAIGSTLDQHNDLISDISERTSLAHGRTTKATREIQGLLH